MALVLTWVCSEPICGRNTEYLDCFLLGEISSNSEEAYPQQEGRGWWGCASYIHMGQDAPLESCFFKSYKLFSQYMLINKTRMKHLIFVSHVYHYVVAKIQIFRHSSAYFRRLFFSGGEEGLYVTTYTSNLVIFISG